MHVVSGNLAGSWIEDWDWDWRRLHAGGHFKYITREVWQTLSVSLSVA